MCVLNSVAYASKSIGLAQVAFGAIVVTALVVFAAFFWGFFMIMNGHIPARRLKVLLPHGAVGVLSPLLYTINISVALDAVGREPVSMVSLVCGYASLALLSVQFTMGRAVVRTPPLRLLTPMDSEG